MFTVVSSVVVNKPISEVFNFMLQGSNYPKWISMLKSVNTSGPFTVGMQFDEVTLFQGKEKFSKGVVREIVPNKLIKMEITEVVSGPKLKPLRTWEFSEENGATKIVWTTVVKTGGMMKVMEFMLPGQFKKMVNKFLENLKNVLEEEQVPA